MARTTRARFELVTDDEGRPQWLYWIASSNPTKFCGKHGEPIVKYIAQAGGLTDKTLYPLIDGTRAPNLETLGEIVAAAAHLHGVPDEVAMQHIVRLVHRPIEMAEAA